MRASRQPRSEDPTRSGLRLRLALLSFPPLGQLIAPAIVLLAVAALVGVSTYLKATGRRASNIPPNRDCVYYGKGAYACGPERPKNSN